MLVCENVTKEYRSVTAVQGLSVVIESGGIYALLGPNGSGKTTFMKLVAGLAKPDSGTILFEGKEIGVESKKHIAYMPTESYFYSYMTCLDAGKYYADFFADFSLQKYRDMLSEMDLNPKQKINKMSSGMMAKLRLAVTLSRDSRLIMLDEPLNGVDIIAREEVIDMIKHNIKEGKSFIISSHLVDELESIIDYAVFMKKGSIACQGSVEGLKAEKGQSMVEIYKSIYKHA